MNASELRDVSTLVFESSTSGGFRCKVGTLGTLTNPVTIQVGASHILVITCQDSHLVEKIAVSSIQEVSLLSRTELLIRVRGGATPDIRIVAEDPSDAPRLVTIAKAIRIRSGEADFEPASPAPRAAPDTIRPPSPTVVTPHETNHSTATRQRIETYDNVIHLLEDLLLDNRPVRPLPADSVLRRTEAPLTTNTLGAMNGNTYPHAFKQQMQLHPRTLIGNFRAMTATLDDPAVTEVHSIKDEWPQGWAKHDIEVLPQPLRVPPKTPKTPLRSHIVKFSEDPSEVDAAAMTKTPTTFRPEDRWGHVKDSESEKDHGKDVIDFDRLLMPLVSLEDPPLASPSQRRSVTRRPPLRTSRSMRQDKTTSSMAAHDEPLLDKAATFNSRRTSSNFF